MTTLPLDSAEIDWQEWQLPLRQFTDASGLVVCAYDARGVRRIGPFTATRATALLAESMLWRENGPGAALEQELVKQVLLRCEPAETMFLASLRVCAMPLILRGKAYGVLVYGWCFKDFSSPMACEQIARQLNMPGHVLWSEVRLEAPMSDARMATYRALLQTFVGAIDRQRETISDLNTVNRTRELFLATVSHEMRTPLAALSMRIEFMLKAIPGMPLAAIQGLENMRKHIRQGANMVDDLIDAARTMTGQMSITRAPTALGAVIRDAVSTVEVNAHTRNIGIQVSPADFGDHIPVKVDARRMQQVFWNLLVNAIKFTPDGGTIRLTIRQGADQTHIEIADSGQGISAADLPNVFGAFTLQRHSNPNGLGLGLFIARNIVELHGGSLSVASAGANQGTQFLVTLPT